MKIWLIWFTAILICGCHTPEHRLVIVSNPDAETVRTRMGLLQKGMSRQQAETVLGLKTSCANDLMVSKYLLPTNQFAYLWFYSPCDPNTGLLDTNTTSLMSATFDLGNVTSRIPLLRLGMSIAELEATLGVREPMDMSGSSSGFSLVYWFDDPDYTNDFPAHALSARFSTPYPPQPQGINWQEETTAWVRTNGSLVWLHVDNQPFSLNSRCKP